MAIRVGLCTYFDNCDLADGTSAQEVATSDEFVCSACGRLLTEIEPRRRPRQMILASAMLFTIFIIIGFTGYLGWRLFPHTPQFTSVVVDSAVTAPDTATAAPDSAMAAPDTATAAPDTTVLESPVVVVQPVEQKPSPPPARPTSPPRPPVQLDSLERAMRVYDYLNAMADPSLSRGQANQYRRDALALFSNEDAEVTIVSASGHYLETLTIADYLAKQHLLKRDQVTLISLTTNPDGRIAEITVTETQTY